MTGARLSAYHAIVCSSGAVAEEPHCLGDVGARELHVAAARLAMRRLDLTQLGKALRDAVADHGVELEKRGLVAKGDVVRLPERRGILHRGGEQVRLHHVVDVAEVARRGAVAVDVRHLAAQQRPDPRGDHRRIGTVRVLARAEDVEVAKADGLVAVADVEDIRVELVHLLGEPVGRHGAAGERLDLGQRGVIAIYRARAGVDKPRYAGIPGGDEQVEKAGDIGRGAGDRIIDGPRHAAERRLVQHDVDAGAGALAGIDRTDVALDEADSGRQVFALARGEVVEADDRLAEREQPLGEMRADEAGGARDEPGAAAAPNALLRGFVAVHFCSWVSQAPPAAARSARPSRAPRSAPRRSRARSRPCGYARADRRAPRAARLA